MATNIASLQATLRLVTDQWTAGLTKGASDVDKFGQTVEQKAQKAGKAFDAFRESVRKNEGAFASLGISATQLEGKVLRAMRADVVKGFIDGLKAAGKEAETLTQKIERNSSAITGFGIAAGAVGAAIALAMRQAIASFDTFELAIARATGAAGGGAAEMAEFSGAAKNMAAELGRGGVTVQGAADALVSIAQAGKKGQEALDILRPSMVLAAGAGENFGKMSEAVVAVLNQYALGTKEASRVTDVLAAANNNALGGVGAFTEALRIVGPVAAQMGETIESTSAALALLISTGMDASTAGTSLRQMFLQLSAPSTEARDALAAFGVSVQSINPQTKSLAEIIEILGKKAIDAGTATKVFGDRSATAFTVLAKAGSAGMAEMQQKITGTTAATDTYRVMATRTGASLQELKTQVALVSISMGEKFVKAIQGSTEGLSKLLKILDSFSDPMKQNIANAVALAAAIATMTAAIAGFIVIAPKLVVALRLIASATPAGLIATAAIMGGLELMKMYGEATAGTAQKLGILIERERELAAAIAATPPPVTPIAKNVLRGMESDLATVRAEIDATKKSFQTASAASAEFFAGGTVGGPAATGAPTKKAPVALINVEAMTAMKRGLDEIREKLQALWAQAARESLLPDQAAVAAKIDPVVQSLDKIRKGLVDLGAGGGMLKGFDDMAAAMTKNATSAAQTGESIKKLKEETADLVKVWGEAEVAEGRVREEGERMAASAQNAGQTIGDAFREQAGAIERAREEMEFLARSLDEVDVAVVDEADAIKSLNIAWREAGQLAIALGGAFDATSAKISIQQRVIADLIKNQWDPLGETVKRAVAELDKLKAKAFEEDLERIAVSAALLGPSFHEGDATVNVLSRRMLELADRLGKAHPEVQKLREQISALKGPAVEAAEAIDRVFKDRQREIDAWRTIGESQQRFFEQGLEGWAAYSRSIGDAAGFFDATFLAALTKGTEKFESLRTLAEGLAGDLKSVGSNFVTDFKANLDKGLGFWDSFTGAMSSVWNNLMSSLTRRFADFLIDMAIQAATSQNAGGALGAILSLFGAGAAGGGAVQLSGPGVDTGAGAIGTGAGTGTAGGILGGVQGLGMLQGITSLLKDILAGWNAGVGALGGLQGAASAAWTNLTTPISGSTAALAGVGTAIGIAMIALNKNITDLGKAVESAILAAGFVASFWFGPIALLAAAAINFLLDWTGVFEKASKAWLTFPTRLAETLGKEQASLEAFGKELLKATNLTGVATAIENLRKGVDAFLPGFLDRTAGLGLFTVPGLPGATGTDHEGGRTVNFNSVIQEIQAAINEVLASVRDSISVGFVEAAREAMPDDIFNAFRIGTIEPLRKAFEDLVASADATIDDIKEFEDHMKEVAELVSAFAAVLTNLSAVRSAATKVLPEDLVAPLVAMAAAMNQQLIDLAASGAATTEDLRAMAASVDALRQLVVAFAQEALQLSALAGIASDTLTGGLRDSVLGFTASLRQDLVDLAKTGKATAADLQMLEAKIQALATGVALYQTLSTVIAGLTGDWDAFTQAAIAGSRAALSAAGRAITDAVDMLAKAVDGPELATAASNLYAAILAKYALEAKLISDISKEISDTLSGFGAQLMASAMVAVNYGLERGSTAALQGLLTALDGIQASAFSATTRIWAAVQALNAIAAAVPSVVKGFAGQPGSNPMDLAMGIYNAALPSLTTLGNMFGAALGAGDVKGALDILGQGAAAITALGNAAIAGVEQWLQQANAAAASLAQELIEKENNVAQNAIDSINGKAAAEEAIDKIKLDALNEQRDAAEKLGSLMREVRSAGESLGKFLVNLRLGPQAPPDPVGQFNLAKSLYQQALSRFDPAAPTGKSIQDVQDAAQALLTAAQPVMARASAEYRELFGDVTTALDAVHAAALSFVTPEEEAAASLKLIDDEIKALNEHTKKIRDDAALAVKAIEATRDDNIRAIEQQRDATIAANQANAERTINGIQDAVGAIMGQIAAEQFRLTGILIAQQEAIMKSITGGLDPLVFQLQEQKAERIALENLRDIVYAALTGAATIPGIVRAATGMDFVPRDMPVFVHRGERIQTQVEADAWRSWRPSVSGRADVARAVPAGTSGRMEDSEGGGGATLPPIVNHFHVTGAITNETVRQIGAIVQQSVRRGVGKSEMRKSRRTR